MSVGESHQLQRMLTAIVESAGGQVRFPGFPIQRPLELGNPRLDIGVVPAGGGGEYELPVPEPSDVKFVAQVSALPTITSGIGTGGLEVKFNVDGIVIPCPGAAGAFWARPLQARWASVQPGRPIAYTQEGGLMFAQESTLQAAGAVILEFYAKPHNESMRHFYNRVMDWTSKSGDGDSGSGNIIKSLSGFAPGSATDVTLGTFSSTNPTPTQIFLVGTNMPVGGATKAGQLIVSTPNNADLVFVAESSGLAIASNNPLGALGQDTWNIPVGGKAFFLANSGTQSISARYRS